VQQASGYDVRRGKFSMKQGLTLDALCVTQAEGEESAEDNQAMILDWR
jgi:hypothetical protein